MLELQLGQYLNKVSLYLGLSSLTLASEEGLLIASSDHSDDDHEFVAAMAPISIHSARDNQILQDNFLRKGLNCSVINVTAKDRNLFLCASGRQESISHPELRPLVLGISHLMSSI